MKKIIVAIDFSTCSIHALEYAISIANLVDANIQLVWIDNTITHDIDANFEEHESRKDKSKVLDDIIKKYEGQLNGKLSYKFRKGKVYQEVSLLAKSEKADLIIVGTHGVSGYEEYWIGSNAYRIVTHSPCPVITLRQQSLVKNKVDKIAIPIDSTPQTLDKLDFINQMAHTFKAEIHVVIIYPTIIEALKRKVEINEQKAIAFFKENKTNFVTRKIESDNLTKSMIDYAMQVEADMIGIMIGDVNTRSKVFLGPDAQQFISNSTIPVLNIRP